VYKQGGSDKAAQLRDFFRPPHVETLPFNVDAADRYAQIRANNRVSPADGIHLASASQGGVDLFLTNDRRLNGLSIPGIHFIAGMDVDLF
jgi:predicted nucleic acid-binding protein